MVPSSPSSSAASSSSPSSSPSIGKWKFDVFLSFRGEDTRGGFTDHLYKALTRKGISTFRDENEIEEGEHIPSNLLASIDASRFAIVVVSEDYASSRWCLEELARMFECKKEVLPIFYKVDPSHVKNQSGRFEEAFVKHEKRFGRGDGKVQSWRTFLTELANTKAWLSQSW